MLEISGIIFIEMERFTQCKIKILYDSVDKIPLCSALFIDIVTQYTY